MKKKKIVLNFSDGYSFEIDEKDLEDFICEMGEDVTVDVKIEDGILQGDVKEIKKNNKKK